MTKDFNTHLYKFLRPSSKVPNFDTFPEQRPWPVLYWEMIKYNKSYLFYMISNIKKSAEETISTTTNLPLLSIWEKFHSNMDWYASEDYIWFCVIKHHESMSEEDIKEQIRNLIDIFEEYVN